MFVRLSLYYVMQKETQAVRIMLLIFSLNYQKRTSWGSPYPRACSIKFPPFGVKFTDCSCP